MVLVYGYGLYIQPNYFLGAWRHSEWLERATPLPCPADPKDLVWLKNSTKNITLFTPVVLRLPSLHSFCSSRIHSFYDPTPQPPGRPSPSVWVVARSKAAMLAKTKARTEAV